MDQVCWIHDILDPRPSPGSSRRSGLGEPLDQADQVPRVVTKHGFDAIGSLGGLLSRQNPEVQRFGEAAVDKVTSTPQVGDLLGKGQKAEATR